MVFAVTVTRPIQRVIFSNKPLNGFIRIDGHFKIYPVHQWVKPNESSKFHLGPFTGLSDADDDFGPPYPLYIEVDVPEADEIEWFIDGQRLLDRYEKLAFFFIQGIELASDRRNQSQWTLVYDSQPQGLIASYAITRFGFSVEGDGGFERYLNEGGRAVNPFAGAIGYYDALLTENVLEFPAELDSLLKAYASLSQQQTENFDRAVFLFQQGEYLRFSKFDASVSYSSAIECLLSREKKKCKDCGQDIFGVGRKFKEFMDEFAPVSAGLVEVRKRLYDVRSKAAHGMQVPRVDRDPGLSSFDENDIIFPWLVRKGIVNWLANTSTPQA